MITLAAYWMGRDTKYAAELTDEIRKNAADTIAKANLLIAVYHARTGDEEQRVVTSGWRPAGINASTPGAAPRSKHMTGQAIDIADPEGDLDEWCMEHTDILQSIGLWLEHPGATKSWCHLQIVPPKSGKRIFWP